MERRLLLLLAGLVVSSCSSGDVTDPVAEAADAPVTSAVEPVDESTVGTSTTPPTTPPTTSTTSTVPEPVV